MWVPRSVRQSLSSRYDSVRQSLANRYDIPLYKKTQVEFLRTCCGIASREIKILSGLYDPLTLLAAKYKSDKGVTIYPFHGYTVHYAKLFKKFKDEPINILEIGLAKPTQRHALGMVCPSLSMWLDYFPNANVYGFDIDDFSTVELPRVKIFRGDQGSVEDLLTVVAQCPRFDVIIDDGSHASYHQQVSLKTLFPFLAPDGLYIIEDLQWQPPEIEASLPSVGKTRELLKNKSELERIIAGVQEVLFFESFNDRRKEAPFAIIVKK